MKRVMLVVILALLVYSVGIFAQSQPTSPITSPRGITMAWIPAGTFMMGSPVREKGRFNKEGPQGW